MLFHIEILFIPLYLISELKTQSSLKIDFDKYVVYIASFKFHTFLFFPLFISQIYCTYM